MISDTDELASQIAYTEAVFAIRANRMEEAEKKLKDAADGSALRHRELNEFLAALKTERNEPEGDFDALIHDYSLDMDDWDADLAEALAERD